MTQPAEAAPHVEPLSPRQRDVLRLIAGHTKATGEPPSVLYLCRRLGLSRAAVREHIDALYRKGWLRSPAPGGLRCTHQPPAEEGTRQ